MLALVKGEPGMETVAEILPNACMSAVNFSEVVAKLAESASSENEIRELLAGFNLLVVPFEQAQSYTAGWLRPITKTLGLSFGDRACLALGLQLQCPVMTADQAWAALDIGLEIQVIR